MSDLVNKLKNKKKLLLGVLLVALVPILSIVFNFTIRIIFEFGQIVGTFIRTFIEKGVC